MTSVAPSAGTQLDGTAAEIRLRHSLFSPMSHAVAAEFLTGYRGGIARAERREHRGEPILVSWYDHDAGPAVRDVVRITEEEGRVASIRFYFFCPEVIAEVAGELNLAWRSNGYRYWPKEPSAGSQG